MVYLSCQVAQVLKPGSLGRTGPTGHEICGAEIFRSRRGPRREDLPTQGYIPWQIHGRNGIFTDPWMVDVYGKFVGKSTNPPWLLWVRLKMKSVCSNFLGSPWSWYMSYLKPQNRRGTAHDCSRQSQGPQVMDLQSHQGVPLWWWEPLTMRKG